MKAMKVLVVLLSAQIAGAQDAPEFDLVSGWPTYWELGIGDAIRIVASYLILYGLLVAARRFITPRRSEIPWRTLRYAVPSAGTIVLGVGALSQVTPLAIAAGVLNLPALLLVWPVGQIAMEEPIVPRWIIWPAVWIAWYVIIRLLEAPTWKTAPLTLNLEDKAK
jgi:hypothetical protein